MIRDRPGMRISCTAGPILTATASWSSWRTADLEGEVQRVMDLGATVLTDEPVAKEGWRWHILADPDGNEFCVVQPPA
jgi:predicted enzyme related to lactoylglutathione lyase